MDWPQIFKQTTYLYILTLFNASETIKPFVPFSTNTYTYVHGTRRSNGYKQTKTALQM